MLLKLREFVRMLFKIITGLAVISPSTIGIALYGEILMAMKIICPNLGVKVKSTKCLQDFLYFNFSSHAQTQLLDHSIFLQC